MTEPRRSLVSTGVERTWLLQAGQLGKDTGQLVLHVVLALLALLTFGPFVWMVLSSFKRSDEILAVPPTIWPAQPTAAIYGQIFGELQFGHALANSTVVAAVSTLAVLVTSSAAGFVFAKYQFPLKDILFALLLATMMVPFTVVMIPLFVLVTNLGLQDSLQGLIVTGLVRAFGIFLMRQTIQGIPDELIHAARVDGASEGWIFLRVIVPLTKTSLAALAIFEFLWNWDSFLWPLVILTDPAKMTLPLVLARLQWEHFVRYDASFAGATLTVAPVILIYTLAQRQFIRGITLTGLKA